MRVAFIGLIIGFSFAGNIYAYALHTGRVVSVKAVCAQSGAGDYLSELQRGVK